MGCKYCEEEDADGYIFPLDKNAHVTIYRHVPHNPTRDALHINYYGHSLNIKINYCPMCGRSLTEDITK